MNRPPSRAILLVVALALTACASVDPASTTVPFPSTASVELSPVSATPSVTPTLSAEPASPSPSPPEGGLAHDSMVAALVDQIALRDRPSRSARLIGYLPIGSRSFVVDGPASTDGYEWMLLAGPGLPPASGCATFPTSELTCPTWFGWAAIADPATGDMWFAEDPTDCPDAAGGDTYEAMMLGDIEALHCYGGQQLVVPGWLPAESVADGPACPSEDFGAWLMCEPAASLLGNRDDAVSIELYVDPASDVDMSIAPTGYVTVIGHVDDPAADLCYTASVADLIDTRLWELNCRAKFVVDLIGAVGP